MKYSDSVKAILLATINEFASNPDDYAVHPAKDFSRNRKLGFKDFLLMFLTMEGDCIKEELYRYFGRITDAPSKAAFHKQRSKLKHDALRKFLFLFNKKLKKNLYKDKYQLIACDGSTADIFRNPDDKDTFYEPNNKSPRGYNQIHINAFYSILDRRFQDIVIQPGRKHNEYSAFCEMVDTADAADPATIYICDRGYASFNDFAHVIENDQSFLIRCTDKKTESLLGFSLDGIREIDCHVDRILSRSQSKKNRLQPDKEDNYRHICKDVPLDYLSEDNPEYTISLRIVRIEISENCFENLITNLPDLEFDISEFKDLYHLRWSEENAFRDIKYPLCLKAFHSKKYKYIIQEVWARAILHNFGTEIVANTTIERGKMKYEYQANYSEAFKICRDFLRIHDGNTILDVEGLIAQNIEAIRPDRIFPRQKRFKLPLSFCYRN
ncbi:MAG: IS4 family transposase [Lachnospiraceae bacterium]|nr:IS4 family transposase [Lachnospiraceae bacterium]